MAVDLKGFNLEADTTTPFVKFVESKLESNSQYREDEAARKKNIRRRQQVELFGGASAVIPEDDFAARWAEYDAQDNASEAESAKRWNNIDEEIDTMKVFERKANGRQPNEAGAKKYDRYHGSSTGGKATHKIRIGQVNADAINDLVQIGAPRGQAVALVAPKNGSRVLKV